MHNHVNALHCNAMQSFAYLEELESMEWIDMHCLCLCYL